MPHSSFLPQFIPLAALDLLELGELTVGRSELTPDLTNLLSICCSLAVLHYVLYCTVGFDHNDLNVQGYEVSLFHNAEASIDGPMMVRTRDFASSTTQVRDHQSTRRLDNHVSGQAEFMVSQVYQVQPPSPLAYRRQSACPPVWLHAFARSLVNIIVVLIITDMPPSLLHLHACQ